MARKKTPAQIKIRLPEALRRDLEREADKAGRTLNGEIVHQLTQPFVQADRQEVVREAAKQAALDAINNMLAKVSRDDFARAADAATSPETRFTEIHPTKPQSSKPQEDNK